MLLENLGDDGDRRVNGVRNDKHERLGGSRRYTDREITDDACVDLLVVSIKNRISLEYNLTLKRSSLCAPQVSNEWYDLH